MAQQPKLTFKEIIDLRNDIPSLVGLPGGPLGIGIAYDPFKDRIIFTAGFPIGKLVILQRDPKDATKIKAVLADINFDVGDPTTSREGKVAVVPLEAQKAGFTPGEIFATRPRAKDINGNSIPFTEVYRIIEDKKDHFVPILFAKLPTNPELGARAIDFDKVGTWGNAMLVTTTDGKVFKVTPDPTSDPPSKVEQIIDLGIDPKKNIIEGITVAPQGFGPIGGDIIIGHDCQVLAIAPDKTVTVVVDGFKTLPRLVFPDGRPDERTCVEDLDFVPEGENLFVTTDSESRNPNAKPPLPVQDFLVVALLDQFKNQGLIGHLLVTIENPNQIWDVFFDSTTQQFVKRPLAKGLNEQEPSENDSSSGLLLHGEHVSFGKVINRAPTAPPIPDIVQVQECTSVTIDGSGATDPDGDKLSFKWELIAAPPGVRVPRTLSASPKLTFSPTQPGIYRVRLTVSDGRGGTATVETSINVIPSLGCDFIPGEKDFELMMNALVHHIYEVIVDTNHARNLISQNRSETLIADSIDQALELMAEIPADFAELFGQLD
ncbi:PKD domain-containing protein, partial [Candidatus Acetothermia bacterium]|nr:PKD domain-containing protein [Candidatus Acetothermia bacterium]